MAWLEVGFRRRRGAAWLAIDPQVVAGWQRRFKADGRLGVRTRPRERPSIRTRVSVQVMREVFQRLDNNPLLGHSRGQGVWRCVPIGRRSAFAGPRGHGGIPGRTSPPGASPSSAGGWRPRWPGAPIGKRWTGRLRRSCRTIRSGGIGRTTAPLPTGASTPCPQRGSWAMPGCRRRTSPPQAGLPPPPADPPGALARPASAPQLWDGCGAEPLGADPRGGDLG
jgi:hypothetical protein